MKTFYLVIASLLFACLQSNAQTWQWTHPETNPDPNSQNYAHDVEVDSSGNVYVLGTYNDSLFLSSNFIAKGNGSYIAKYNPSGTLLWYKLITTSPSNTVSGYTIHATDMVVNGQGVFITGKYDPVPYYDYDCNTHVYGGPSITYQVGNFNFISQYNDLGFFLTKFNSSGAVVWNKLGTVDICNDGVGKILNNPNITSDKNNNITASFILQDYVGYLTHISLGGDNIPVSHSIAPNVYQLVAAKYNSTGIFQWSAYAGGGFNAQGNEGTGFIQECNSTAADNNGNIFFYGTAKDSTFFGSQLFRTSTPPSESGYYYPATFIAKLSSKGVWQFAKELSNGSLNTYNDGFSYHTANPDFLTVDGNNNVYALVNAGSNTSQIILGNTTGHTKNNANFLVKMTNNGNLVWDKFFGVDVSTYGRSISYYNNSLYINGSIAPNQGLLFSDLYFAPDYTGEVGYESFVAKSDLNGNYQWVTGFGDSNTYPVWGAGVKAYQDNIYTCGNYYPQITTLGNLNGSSPTASNSIFFGKLKDQYIRVGAVAPTNIIPGCAITVPFTSTGLTFPAGNTFTAELSDSYGDFAAATAIGTTISTGTGSITATIPAGLTYGSGYRLRIRSSDTLATGYNYYAYADTGYALSLTCPPPSAGFSATNITATSATVNWTAVGCAAGYKVQYRVKGTTTWTTMNISTNTPALNISALTANTIYQWRVASKCKNNGTNSFSAFSSNKQFATPVSFVADNVIADNKIQSAAIKIYPNPATNSAELMFTALKAAKYNIEITDLSGKILQQKNGNVLQGENKITLDVSSYANGVYLINVTDDEHGKRVLKLNKE